MAERASQMWRCIVCGYIYEGSAPPEECPVCGAPSEEFEPYIEQPAVAAAAPVLRWRCTVCDYVHAGDSPQEECPVCGASADCFEPTTEPKVIAGGAGHPLKTIILGAGIAGLAAAESLRAASPQAEIILISSEVDLPYYRLNLTRYLAGEIGAADLPVHPASWYDQNMIRLMTGTTVAAIEPARHQVTLESGEALAYDKLILAAGSHAFVPPIDGSQLAGVAVQRSLADANQILEVSRQGVRCICIGGGILGLEVAGALARRGVLVTLLEGFGWLLPRQLSQRAGEILADRIREAGIQLRLGAATRRIHGDIRVQGVELGDGEVLPADLAVITTGVRSNTHLARQAGLAVNQGVIVDNCLTTSHPDILAAGDVAEHRGVVYGLWGPALYQGRIAGLNATGLETPFGGVPRSNTLKVLGIDLFSIGEIEAKDASYLALEEERDGHYCRLLIRDQRLCGAILLGEAKAAGVLKKALEARKDLSASLRSRPSAWELVQDLKD